MISVAATGMEAAQQQIQTISNDLANANSAGYKSARAIFATQMYTDKAGVGSVSSSNGNIIPAGTQIGLGTKLQGITHNLRQGNPVRTDDPYHLTIQGNGYFQVQLPSGETVYTRSGVFTLSPDGTLVTLEGFVVSPGITIPPNSLSTNISATGEVSVKVAGQVSAQIVGQIELASFSNPGGLQALDNTMFLQTAASGTPIAGQPGQIGYGKILQYWYEGSNVDMITGVTDLIEAQRLFEICSKAVKTEDEMLAQLKSIVS